MWEAARGKGVRPLSWRMYLTLLDCAQTHGSHAANNGLAAYALARRGLAVTEPYPYAHATDKGRELLARIAQAAL